ncbi:hypothetical protein L9F63_004600 [Diploptera punctata]|uniref:Uncharacterized protein n=1 Tax=Diploptera punctata TaxID=6984 RepID=A0AAD8E788_DIPPU|nr:hypothetical protein L9F63_004600 [Diploptera punctata]
MLAISRTLYRHQTVHVIEGGIFEINLKHIRDFSNEKEENMPKVKDPQQIEKRRKFWEQEKTFEAQVDYSRLNDMEKLIHKTHAEAVARGHFTYDDPENGDRVLTRLRHFLKGSCCGSACRHCIYDHIKVPEIKKKSRKFNTAYWTYDENTDQINYLGEGLNKVKTIKERPLVTHKMIITNDKE